MTSLTLASNGGSWLAPILAALAPVTCRARFLPPYTEEGEKEGVRGGCGRVWEGEGEDGEGG